MKKFIKSSTEIPAEYADLVNQIEDTMRATASKYEVPYTIESEMGHDLYYDADSEWCPRIWFKIDYKSDGFDVRDVVKTDVTAFVTLNQYTRDEYASSSEICKYAADVVNKCCKNYVKYTRGHKPDAVFDDLSYDTYDALKRSPGLVGPRSYTDVYNPDALIDPEDFLESRKERAYKYARGGSMNVDDYEMNHANIIYEYLKNNPTTYRELQRLVSKTKRVPKRSR